MVVSCCITWNAEEYCALVFQGGSLESNRISTRVQASKWKLRFLCRMNILGQMKAENFLLYAHVWPSWKPDQIELIDWMLRIRISGTVVCCIVLYCIVLYCIVLYCIVLYCIVLYCIVLYCIVLYCIVLYWHVMTFYTGGIVVRWTFAAPTRGSPWILGAPTILVSGISTSGTAAAVSNGAVGPGGNSQHAIDCFSASHSNLQNTSFQFANYILYTARTRLIVVCIGIYMVILWQGTHFMAPEITSMY